MQFFQPVVPWSYPPFPCRSHLRVLRRVFYSDVNSVYAEHEKPSIRGCHCRYVLTRACATHLGRARSWISCSTTLGSDRVDMSPNWPCSPAAILRRIRRMIFPERVFGSAGAHWMASGVAIGLISRRTQSRNSARNGSLGSTPAINVTYA